MLKLLLILEGGIERNPHNLKLPDYYAYCNRIKIVEHLPNEARVTFRLGTRMCIHEAPLARQHMYHRHVAYDSLDGAEIFGDEFDDFEKKFEETEMLEGEQLLNFLAYCARSSWRLPHYRSPWDRVIQIPDEQFPPEEAYGFYLQPMEDIPTVFTIKKKKDE